MRWIFAVLLALGCQPGPVRQILDFEGTVYKRDVKLVFEGKEYQGVGVLPKRAKYDLDLTFVGAVDLYTFRTCHREVTQEDAGGGKIFGKKDRVKFTYTPVPGIEDDLCVVEIIGHEKGPGRHSWGFFDFEGDVDTLPAVVLCNGQRTGFNGVSVCQARAGLITQIFFSTPVNFEYDSACIAPYTADSMKFDLVHPVGRCVYTFQEKGAQHSRHRFSTVGYQDILLKNAN